GQGGEGCDAAQVQPAPGRNGALGWIAWGLSPHADAWPGLAPHGGARPWPKWEGAAKLIGNVYRPRQGLTPESGVMALWRSVPAGPCNCRDPFSGTCESVGEAA